MQSGTRHACAAVEQIRHNSDSPGQILALALAIFQGGVPEREP